MDVADRFSILLVDDRPENLVAVEAALADVGQNVVKARSGREALRELLAHDFVVILLDVNMPEMDGFETAALIRRRKRCETTPIIFMTAEMSSEADLARGYALGAVDYLFTPIEPDILRAKVATFVDLARKAEQRRRHLDEERAAAESRATNLESRLQSLFNRLDIGIFRSTLDGRLLDANPALLRLLGFASLDEARDDARWSARRGGRELLLARRADGEPAQEEILEVGTGTGGPVYVSVTKTLSVGPDGVRFVEGLVTDITRRRQAEEERETLLASERSARHEAELANQVKDEFLATLSHELRSPLNAILGWTELLRPAPVDSQELSLGLEVITRNARMQTRLINDLLDMNRIMSGKLTIDVQDVELTPIVRGVVESFQPVLEKKEIRLETELEPGLVPLRGDPVRLQQIVWNLLSNATKFSRRQGVVRISLQRADDFLRFSVLDDGEGIEAEFLPHVFGRFRQADATSTRRHSGLGLGLAIVQHLVELHGGRVTAHSDGLGKGARFDVLLPVKAPATAENLPVSAGEEEVRAAGPLADALPTLEGLRVLLVEDMADAREVMRLALERRSARVTTADSALQALEMIQRERPDVLISDIAMPEFDGYYLIDRLRSLPPEQGGSLPAVAVTSFARSEDRARALTAGYDDYLAKPVEPSRLVHVVARLARCA